MENILPGEEAKLLYSILLNAGTHAIRAQNNPLARKQKSGRDFATEADIEVQKYILSQLSEYLPHLEVLGEEDERPRIPGGRFITIDPIDGTFAFAAGADSWGILLSIIEHHQPSMGFIYQPLRQRMIFAQRGHGCYLNGNRIEVVKPPVLAETIIALAQGCWNSQEELLQINVPLAHAALCTICPSSAVEAAMELLRGVCGGYFNQVGKIWDFAPLAIALEEAGGIVCTPRGKPIVWNTISVPCLFANSVELQQELLGTISKSSALVDVSAADTSLPGDPLSAA